MDQTVYVYNYDPITKVLTFRQQADESPREPGVYLVPQFATMAVPPEPKDGKQIIWDGECWRHGDLPKEETQEYKENEIKQQAVDSVNVLVTKTIRNGFVSSALGRPHKYDSTMIDQQNLATKAALAAVSGGSVVIRCKPEAAEAAIDLSHKKDQVATVIADLDKHVEYWREEGRKTKQAIWASRGSSGLQKAIDSWIGLKAE